MLDEIRNGFAEEYDPATNWELRLTDQAAMVYFRALRSRRSGRGLFKPAPARRKPPGRQPGRRHRPRPWSDNPKRMKNFFRYDAGAERALRELDLTRKHRLQVQAINPSASFRDPPFAPLISQNRSAGSLASCVPPPSGPPSRADTPAKGPGDLGARAALYAPAQDRRS